MDVLLSTRQGGGSRLGNDDVAEWRSLCRRSQDFAILADVVAVGVCTELDIFEAYLEECLAAVCLTHVNREAQEA